MRIELSFNEGSYYGKIINNFDYIARCILPRISLLSTSLSLYIYGSCHVFFPSKYISHRQPKRLTAGCAMDKYTIRILALALLSLYLVCSATVAQCKHTNPV